MFAMEQQQNQSPRHQRSRETPEKTASKKTEHEKHGKKQKIEGDFASAGGGRHGISPVSPTPLGELGD
jgi:hypothetical protein